MVFSENTKFWDDLLRQLTVCQELENNWEKIKDEYLKFENHEHPYAASGNRTCLPAPNVTLSHSRYENDEANLNDEERYKLYDGIWDVTVAGTMPGNDPKQWGNTEMVKKILRWKTKVDLKTHLDYAKTQFSTFNKIVQQYADEGQCSGGMFSIVQPGTVINPHFGSDEIMRVHLCLENDTDCRITVGDETHQWEEGKILAFKDGKPFVHSVSHAGSKRRVVLMFDFDMEYLRNKFPGVNGL